MSMKNVMTCGLLLFVAASIVVLTVKSLRGKPQAEPDPAGAAATGSLGSGRQTPLGDGVVAYYFHGNVRCPTCRSIEAYAQEAIQRGFADQLKSGRLRWRVVNYEEPGNEHFGTEYEIVAPTVVLARIEGGAEKKHENLARVWELVGDKKAFIDYVQEETRTMLAN